jgi:hypothetical protein
MKAHSEQFLSSRKCGQSTLERFFLPSILSNRKWLQVTKRPSLFSHNINSIEK